MKIERPEKDQYYLDIARVVSARSTCTKVLMGAIIVKEDQIIAAGYVGAPRHTRSSIEHGFCLRKKLNIPSGQQYELCRSVHAEQNAIINAARAGVSLFGGDIYIYGESRETNQAINAFPCFICKKMLINCELKRVVTSLKPAEVPGAQKKKHMIFQVEDWVNDWKHNDIIDDKYQYGK